jgi:hypothetical protein
VEEAAGGEARCERELGFEKLGTGSSRVVSSTRLQGSDVVSRTAIRRSSPHSAAVSRNNSADPTVPRQLPTVPSLNRTGSRHPLRFPFHPTTTTHRHHRPPPPLF